MAANDPHYEVPPEFELAPEIPSHAEMVEKQRLEIMNVPTPGPSAVTPMRLLEIAMTKGVDVDQLAKLLALQERWEANEAKKAYIAAMRAFKAQAPEILRNRTASIESKKEGAANYSYSYATLDNVCDVLAPALSAHGLTHRWKISQTEGKVRVTCVITHELGHSEEESTLEAGADQTGGKNNLQAYGSTVTYLERYTLLAACGVAVKGGDTDAVPPMPGLDMCLKAIEEAPDTSALQKIFRESTAKAMLAKNGPAIITLGAARDKRKKELEAQ